MFKSIIANTPLTEETASNYFAGRIEGRGRPWSGDYSFLATLRALLDSRMPQDDALLFSINETGYSASQLQGTPISTALHVLMEDMGGAGVFRIHNFRSSDPGSNEAWMAAVKSSLESYYAGWHFLERVTLYFKKKFNVLCFINPELKSVILFVDGMDIRKYHYLQAGIPAFLPWYFSQEDGITEIEMELLQSLRERTSRHYEECIARIAEQYDFETERVRMLLSGFETRYEKAKYDEVSEYLEAIMTEINGLNERIGQCLRRQRDWQNELAGLEMKINQGEGDSEIMDYFLCNNHLVLIDVTNTTMRFVARDYLTYFDEDMADRIINNPMSYIYAGASDAFPAEDMKMLMTAVFLDQKLKIKFCAAYDFQLEGNVSAIGRFNYGYEFREYMPNPHIDRYRCMGGYTNVINKHLQGRNYIGALEQAVASCKSLNFGDSVVMREFISQLYRRAEVPVNNRCIELPDGRVVTPKEAVEYLKSQTEDRENG